MVVEVDVLLLADGGVRVRRELDVEIERDERERGQRKRADDDRAARLDVELRGGALELPCRHTGGDDLDPRAERVIAARGGGAGQLRVGPTTSNQQRAYRDPSPPEGAGRPPVACASSIPTPSWGGRRAGVGEESDRPAHVISERDRRNMQGRPCHLLRENDSGIPARAGLAALWVILSIGVIHPSGCVSSRARTGPLALGLSAETS